MTDVRGTLTAAYTRRPVSALTSLRALRASLSASTTRAPGGNVRPTTFSFFSARYACTPASSRAVITLPSPYDVGLDCVSVRTPAAGEAGRGRLHRLDKRRRHVEGGFDCIDPHAQQESHIVGGLAVREDQRAVLHLRAESGYWSIRSSWSIQRPSGWSMRRIHEPFG